MKQGTGTVAGMPSLIRYQVDDGSIKQEGSGLSFQRTLSAADAGSLRVRMYADANDNQVWDAGEPALTSPWFFVVQRKVYEFGVWYSSALPGGDPSTTIAADLAYGTDILLRKDSDEDYRAAVELKLSGAAPHMFAATASGGAMPDPVSTDDDITTLFSATPAWTTIAVNDFVGHRGRADAIYGGVF